MSFFITFHTHLGYQFHQGLKSTAVHNYVNECELCPWEDMDPASSFQINEKPFCMLLWIKKQYSCMYKTIFIGEKGQIIYQHSEINNASSRKTHWFNRSQYIQLSMLSWITFAVVVSWGSPDAPAWQRFMLDLDLKPQWSGNSVRVRSEWEKVTEMWQDEETFWSPTPPHMARNASLEINYVNTELCKCYIWINLRVWGEKILVWFSTSESGAKRERERDEERGLKQGLGWRMSLADTVCAVKPDLAF